jgi:hypothetical protein
VGCGGGGGDGDVKCGLLGGRRVREKVKEIEIETEREKRE